MPNKKTFPYKSSNLSLIKINLKPALSIVFYFFFAINLTGTTSILSSYSESIETDHCKTTSTTGSLSFTYGSYYGSSINNNFNDVKIDNNGNIYAFGSTISQGFDGVLVKFDPSGAIIWERLIGGTDADNNHPDNNFDYGKIALDPAGNCYLTGITNSDNLPLLNPFQNTRGGGTDAYIAKYDPTGNLLFASYLGGSENENDLGAGDIGVDLNGNIFITGTTKSSNFFNTNTAFQNTLSSIDEPDIFVVKISPDFSTVTGTYWGDENVDVSRTLAISSNGTIWVGGYSENSTLSLPNGSNTSIDAKDGILLAFSNDLSQLDNGSFYGGIFDDEINDIAIDPSDNIYATGSSFSTSDFPILNAFQAFYQGGEMAFMAKFSSNATLLMSTFLGGSQNEKGNSITINDQEEIFITGSTSSPDFPFHQTAQATYNDWNCNYDGFIFKFKADGTRDWSTAYGGWRGDDPRSIALKNNGQIIVAGRTNSTDLPTSPDAHQAEAAFAGINAFFAFFEIACPSIPIIIHSSENAIYHDQFWCSSPIIPTRHHFQADTCALQFIGPPGYNDYQWTRNGSLFNIGQIISVRNPGSSANDIYRLSLLDGNDCGIESISNPIKPDWIRPMCGFGSSFNEDELPHKATIIEGTTNEFYCVGDPINYPLSADGFCGSSWQWQKNFEDIPNETTENYTVTEPGCYRIAITNDFTGCTVYSISKQFILLDSIRLNSREDSRNCIAESQVDGCTDVELQARINTCTGCFSAPTGLTYQFFRNGTLYRSSTSSRLTTSDPGNYYVRVIQNGCEIISNLTNVQIRPTERPTWVLPTERPTCIANKDSLIFTVSHPAASDSAEIRFDFPFPMLDIIGFDSTITVNILTSGCMDVDLTRSDGCQSSSERIELHDDLKQLKIELNGPGCIPVRLDIEDIGSCEMDSIFWFKGDTLVYDRNFMARYTVDEPGNYHAKIKNACGTFYSDTVKILGNLPTANISPVGPVCLPANLNLDFPNPNNSIIVKWYRNPTISGCNRSILNLIPDENGTSLVAGIPGFYFAVLEDTITGCKSLCSNKVEVQRSVAGAGILPSNNIYFCEGNGAGNQTFTVTPSSTSFTYQWYRNGNIISGATSANYTTDQEGVYRAYLENACDNSFTPTVSVFNIANPTVTIANPDTIYLCGPDTIPLLAQSDQPILFQWFKDDIEILDAVDSIFLATSAGKYEVFGKNNNSQCEKISKSVYIINSVPISASIAMSPACSSPCSGSLTANVSGGIPFPGNTYNYEWSNGDHTKTINNLCVGNYQLTITDEVGCNTFLSTNITSGFSVSVMVDSINCFGFDNGRIELSTQGGIAPFSYHWNTGSSTASIIDLSPGNYQVTVTDGFNCSTVTNFILSPPTQLNLNLIPTDVTCFGANDGSILTESSGGTLPHILSWDSNFHPDSSNLSPGWYQVTLTDNNNCELVDSVIILEPSELEVSLQITNGLDCPGSTDGAINSLASGGTGPYSYLWNVGSIMADLNNISADTFTLIITDQQNCQTSAEIILMAAESFAVIIDEQQNITCHGSSTGSIKTMIQGGTNPIQLFLNGNPIVTADLENLPVGIYEIFATDFNNCATTTVSVNLTEPAPILTTILTDSVSCFGTETGSVLLTTIGGTGNPNYLWDNGLTINRIDNLLAGNYSVTVTDSLLCEEIISFDILEPLPLSTNFSIKQVDCFQEKSGNINSILTTGGTPPYRHFLEGEDLPLGNQQLDSLSAGSYELITKDAHDCELIQNFEITEPALFLVNLNIQDSLKCKGGMTGSLEANALGGTAPYNYEWSDGTTTSSNENLFAGTYQVTITDSLGCSVSSDLFLPDGPFLNISISNQRNLSCSGSDDGSITIEANGGTAPFQFFINQDSADIGIFENLPEGEYAFYIQDRNNCISDIERIEITSPEVLAATVSTNHVVCPNGNSGEAFIFPSGGTEPYSYIWNNGLTTNSATSLRTGAYEITISDAQGCQANYSFTIQEPNSITHNLEIQPTSCYGGGDGSFFINNTTGGSPPYQYYFNDSLLMIGDLFIDSLSAGSYILKTIDQKNCAHQEIILIQEPAQLEVDLGEDQTIVLGQSTTIPINFSGGFDTISYLISPMTYLDCYQSDYYNCSEPTVFQPLKDTNYEITLIDGHGCMATDEIAITVTPADHFIYMANVFNPYSSNGNELFFTQATSAVAQIKSFKIFNRWGAPVFSKTNFLPNDKAFGWDGNLKGEMVNTGVYIYRVVFETIDGVEMQQTGDVTVIW